MKSTDCRQPRYHPPLGLPANPPLCSGRRCVWLTMMLALALCGWLPLAPVWAAPVQQASGNPVPVSLVEFEIRMSKALPAGPTTFTVTNNGTHEHNFEIEGQGIEQVFPANLQPGETNTLQIDLKPGAYTVYCPVDGHRGQGMELTLTVTEAAAQATPPAEQSTGATPAVLPTTGGDPTAVAAHTVPVVALVLLGLAVGTWVAQRRQA